MEVTENSDKAAAWMYDDGDGNSYLSHHRLQPGQIPYGRETPLYTRPTSAGQSEEVVERAAKAIHAAHMETKGQLSAWTWEEASKDFYNRIARAALSALDLPSVQRDARREAMEEAARECERMDDVATYDDETDEGRMYGAGYQEATGKCAAAIRALKEGTGE